jgi:hypothetical protein
VLARRIAYVLAVLILLGAIGSAISTRELQRTQAVAPPDGGPPATPAPVASGDMPPDRVVRARVGDVVSLDVRTVQPDTATIMAFGVSAVTSAQVPGTLEFVAAEPGRYPVELEDSGRVAGSVVVSPAAR